MGEAQEQTGRRITAMRPVGPDGARVAVKAGRRTVATIDAEDARTLGIEPGTVLTDALADALDLAAGELKARTDALRLLSTRARSRAELEQGLRRKGHEPEVARRVGQRLERAGLIDDEAYALEAARAEVGRTPAGARRIEQKLRSRGVAGEVARRAAADALEGRDVLEDAVALAGSRIGRMAGLDRRTLERRLFGVLARRGFDPETGRQAVRRVAGGASDEEA